MAWSSILPPSISFVEYWVTRFFLLLSALVIGPWLLLLMYDAFLYLFRVATYDIPYVGGRARNRPRPRAPSLSERPSGRARTFSVTVPGMPTSVESVEEKVEGLKRRLEKADS